MNNNNWTGENPLRSFSANYGVNNSNASYSDLSQDNTQGGISRRSASTADFSNSVQSTGRLSPRSVSGLTSRRSRKYFDSMSGSQSSPPSNGSGPSNPVYRKMSRNLKQSLCSQVLTSAEDVVEQTKRHVDEYAARGQRELLHQQEQREMLLQNSGNATGKSVHKPSRKYVQVHSSGYGQARRPSSGRISNGVDPDHNSSTGNGIGERWTTGSSDEVNVAGSRSRNYVGQHQHANRQRQSYNHQQHRGSSTNTMLYDDAHRARIYVTNAQLKKVENARFAAFKSEQERYSVPMLDIDAYPSDDDSTLVLTPPEIKAKYVYNDPSKTSSNGGRGRKSKSVKMQSGGSGDIRSTPRGGSSGNNGSAIAVQAASKRGQIHAQHAENERSRSSGQHSSRGDNRQSIQNDRGRSTFVSGAV